MDLDLFFSGFESHAYEYFGSHIQDNGVIFRVYAPNAYKISLISSFDNWLNEYPLNRIDERGIYELFIDNLEPIYAYRYRIYKDEYIFHDKIDPYAYAFEKRPATASCIYNLDYFSFDDELYRQNTSMTKDDEAMNIYEVYFNSFRQEGVSSYRLLADKLIPYCIDNGYNYVEFMPVFEHPFDGSWGYQASGFFAVTSRYGTPYDFMDLINKLHQAGIGVLLDVVYAHFVADEFGLVNYDFKELYEYSDNNMKYSEWGTLYFDLYNPAVISFLMSSADFFLSRYHIDGLRFDAVSHFIYHRGNKDLGINEGGLSFLKRLNYALKTNHPKAILVAEDSSDYPHVTGKVEDGHLGFDYKWDLGWMNDTLKYYSMDHIYRKYHHNLINFSMYYFYSERFLLPLSHDEVVHGKKTIIDKMFGTYEEKFALCRNLYVYMYTHPGKKLNFLGNDIAQFREFDETKECDWFLLKYPIHDAFNKFFKDLTKLYLSEKALYNHDYDPLSFRWIDADNAEQSIYSYIREDEKECLVIILNMLPINYDEFLLGVPYKGKYVEILNSQKDIYGGANHLNYNLKALRGKKHNFSYHLKLHLAPFAAIVFKHKK